jgi:hypothetical protein
MPHLIPRLILTHNLTDRLSLLFFLVLFYHRTIHVLQIIGHPSLHHIFALVPVFSRFCELVFLWNADSARAFLFHDSRFLVLAVFHAKSAGLPDLYFSLLDSVLLNLFGCEALYTLFLAALIGHHQHICLVFGEFCESGAPLIFER